MIIRGIEIPTTALIFTTIISTAIAGIGIGIGTELGKYIIHTYLMKRINTIANFITDKDIKQKYKSIERVFYKRPTKNKLILAKDD